MSKEDIIRKLTSRKLWMSVAGFISLLVVAAGYTESDAAQITAIIMAGATVLGYVLGEGLVDSKRGDGDAEADGWYEE
jgi:hypothetical protein